MKRSVKPPLPPDVGGTAEVPPWRPPWPSVDSGRVLELDARDVELLHGAMVAHIEACGFGPCPVVAYSLRNFLAGQPSARVVVDGPAPPPFHGDTR